MLVYGDHEEIVDPANWLERLKETLGEVEKLAPGIDRHGNLVGALIDAGRLLQGLADARAPTEDYEQIPSPTRGQFAALVGHGFSGDR